MKRSGLIPVAVLFLLSAFSCSKSGQEEAYGYLYVNLDEDDSQEIVVRSTPSEERVFSVTVYDALGKQVAYTEDYRTLENDPLVLPAGRSEYTALASSGTDSAAAFDEPFYSGSSRFRIETGQTTGVDILCSLANVKVTADFSGIKEFFKEYELTVTNGLGELVFGNASEPSTEDRTGYFSVTGTLAWTLRLVNNEGKQYKLLTKEYTDVEANRHYALVFSIEEDSGADGAGAVTVTVDDSMTEESVGLELDFDDTTVPEITTDFGYEEGQPVTVSAGDAVEKNITLLSEDGFKSIRFSYGKSGDETGPVYELVGAGGDVISALALDGIEAASASEGDKSLNIRLTSYIMNLPIGNYSLDFFLVDANDVFTEERIELEIVSGAEAEAVSVNPWARFATAVARWATETRPEVLSFQYRELPDGEWTDFSGTVETDPSSRTYTAEIRGLRPETEYSLRALTAEGSGNTLISFRTEAEQTLHNMSFDSWYKSGEAWYPNLDDTYKVWDSANGGTAALGTVPTVPEESDVAVAGDGKKAAKLVSSVAFGKFAAGNIYTGKFIQATLMPMGAKLQWGVPFGSRPLALRGYYKYQPKTVDHGSEGGMNGKTDICRIQIMLADWNAPFEISTGDGKFVDVNGSDILAYGSFESNVTMEEYDTFEIRLDYRDVNRKPQYIVVVAAASKYGDYFTGAEGSTLFIDELSFVYDPAELD